MGWHREPLIGFDLETTGTDIENDRIVTAAVEITAGEARGHRERLADPPVPSPPEVVGHGITDARGASEGRPGDEVADAVAGVLADAWRAGTPVVAYNAAFHPRTSSTFQVSQVAQVAGALR
jgi:DNA polymerase-3 subunit epsilon